METATQKPAYRPGQTQRQETASIDDLCDGWQSRTVQEALDEVARECQVRERCFPKWVSEGRVSKSDAKDRLQRLIKAAEILQSAVDNLIPD